MIANRFNPLGRKFGKTAKTYIRDGLLHMWDGIENVGYGQHDSGATYWKDLVSGNDLLPYKNATPPVWDDFGFCGDGTDHTLVSTNLLSGFSEGTFETVVQANGSAQWLVANRYNTSFNAVQVIQYNGSWDVNIFPASGSYLTKKYPGNQLVHIAVACDSNSCTYYLNGETVSQDAGDFSTSIFNNKPLQVGSATYWHGSRKFFMQAGSFVRASRISNRVLSADEIAFNFAIDKERFGIS